MKSLTCHSVQLLDHNEPKLHKITLSLKLVGSSTLPQEKCNSFSKNGGGK